MKEKLEGQIRTLRFLQNFFKFYFALQALIESREPNKYCVDGIDCLIKTRLVNMQQFDMYLTAAMENGFNYTVVSFAMKLVYKYLFDEATTNALLEAKYVSHFLSNLDNFLILIPPAKGKQSFDFEQIVSKIDFEKNLKGNCFL